MNKKYLLAATAVMACGVALAQSPESLAKPIVVSNGSNTFSVSVNSSAGTGYQWYVSDYDSSLVHPVGYSSENAKKINDANDLYGGQLKDTFEFELNENYDVPIMTRVELTSMRPWDANSIAQPVSYIVLIEPKR